MPEPELFTAPDDLSLVGEAELRELETSAVAEFDRISGLQHITPDHITYSQRLTRDLDRLRAELRVRAVRAEEQAATAQQEATRQMALLRQSVHAGEGEGGDGAGGEAAVPAVTAGGRLDMAALTEAMARGMVTALYGEDAPEPVRRRVASLSQVRERAPQAKVPDATMAVTASVDIPGVAAGQSMPTLEALGEAFRAKAKAIPTTQYGERGAPRHLVASVRNQFDHTVDDRTSASTIEELWHSMTQEGGKAEALLAGGGWCAPSQISYEFFNIADAPSGLIDLPTVGVSRGGIRYPVSPAIGDVFFQAGGSNPATGMGGFAATFSNASDPWLWTETDDILTVTGSVNKPTLRVPCPTFNETRLEAYGISLTAGNLTDDAYPEATQNFIRLLRAAYAHTINARKISLMVAASTSAITFGAGTSPATQTLLSGVELAAIDYRAKFGMREDAVLEVVLPVWVLAVIRADLAWRTNVERESVSNAQIMSWFTDRAVRPQFVSDWQVRGAGQFGNVGSNKTSWPTSADFLMYAAGTFLHGNGLQLDLGVIRDSVLNAENDYTALWAEEAHLIAKVGHESRRYTVTFAVDGAGTAGIAAAAQI
ncbi:major capsid protein [Streptomyces sp. S1D4-14]|uniref:major capsid protein n=1 Tax=Streptomyces sp. S1D4-14 TaxID=2594461 RepID=UPI0011655268|nr:major capsid protein [Streptomyces sp. S1D4-14]QDN64437.1 major capsid protein [Streptomyces sp. S1D4-14]